MEEIHNNNHHEEEEVSSSPNVLLETVEESNKDASLPPPSSSAAYCTTTTCDLTTEITISSTTRGVDSCQEEISMRSHTKIVMKQMTIIASRLVEGGSDSPLEEPSIESADLKNELVKANVYARLVFFHALFIVPSILLGCVTTQTVMGHRHFKWPLNICEKKKKKKKKKKYSALI
eukprot:Platyproteum_vivax@DN9481_c0_g1_i1.p1